MRCPVCDDVTLVISSREGIEIDHCPQCRGVWLDRGELDKIIERAAPSVVGTSGPASAGPAQAAAPAPDLRHDRWDEARRYDPRDDRRRRRRSFLEEIFDFD